MENTFFRSLFLILIPYLYKLFESLFCLDIPNSPRPTKSRAADSPYGRWCYAAAAATAAATAFRRCRFYRQSVKKLYLQNLSGKLEDF